MEAVLLVAAGGALGAVSRYLVGVQALRTFGLGWPYGTFAVNVIGGVCMGLLVGVLALRGGADQEKWRLFVGVGVLGGFTTFSSFSLESALMLDRRAYAQFGVYAVSSVVLSIAAIFVGRLIARRFLA
jgi:CrcB protein